MTTATMPIRTGRAAALLALVLIVAIGFGFGFHYQARTRPRTVEMPATGGAPGDGGP